ncbi:MAG: polysaccharide deacetylase family protein [Myxococcaceae bacterium]
MALASISVDLDSLPHYCRIHGLDEGILDDRARRLVYERAIPRYLELFDRLGIRGTFFAIGQDLSEPSAVSMLRQAHLAGVEIGNHSFSHDYALTRLPAGRIREEVLRGDEAIEQAIGQRPSGFRAPGYTLNAALYRVLEERGYAYDSSTFPAAPYYLAKAGVMGALQLAGRPSRAILDSPRVLTAPRRVYRPDPNAPYRPGNGEVLELPIAVAPVSRFPFIGTFAVALPGTVVRAAYLPLRSEPFFNFELHGVDVLDQTDGIPEALVLRQRDLRIPAARKMARLTRIFGWLRRDFDVVTLAEAARRLR